jgi:hypothetical protein
MRRRVRHALQCLDHLAFGARWPLSRADLNPNPGYAQGAAPDRAIAELQELAPKTVGQQQWLEAILGKRARARPRPKSAITRSAR